MQSNNKLQAVASIPLEHEIAAPPGSFLNRVRQSIRDSKPMQSLATLHPCFVNGVRTLVFERGLREARPTVFKRLRQFALTNGFELLEERRSRELHCRDERRRMAPVLAFAAAFMSNAVAAEDGSLTVDGEAVVPTIEIVGERVQTDERKYMNVGGKRFVSQTHGEVEDIRRIADEARANGVHRRGLTRGLQ